MSQVHSLLILGVYANRMEWENLKTEMDWNSQQYYLISISLWYNNFIKLRNVLVESNLNQRCKITSICVLKTKIFTHARFRNAQALSSAKNIHVNMLTYTNKKQRRFIRNFFNIRLTNTCAWSKPTLFYLNIIIA